MASALAGIVTVLLWHVADALVIDRQSKPGEVVRPEIVVPGEWMTDAEDHFLFLPLTIPTDMAQSLKVMTNGESLLVVVTQQPKEEPDSNALRKYKLVVEAM